MSGDFFMRSSAGMSEQLLTRGLRSAVVRMDRAATAIAENKSPRRKISLTRKAAP
jgi:hypothetical protein